MKLVDEREKSESQNGGFLECFSKANRRRTEIATVAMITQQFVGQQLINYSIKLFQSSGVNQCMALWITVGVYMACIGANLGSVWVMKRFGRRKGWL
jgi:SP family general alpha glucoside:H+ symporter-like MFS transporter